MRRLLFALLLICSAPAFADIRPSLPIEQCAHHAPYGHPTSKKSNTTLVCREGYLVEHDNEARIPLWVSYTLTAEKAIGCFGRETTFKQDPALPPGASATAKDYAKSGYDIGHYANNSDMRWSAATEEESNLFLNAAPTVPGLNRGAWKRLEDLTRAWALGRGNILIYIGSEYDRKSSKRLNGRVAVPESLVKILIDQKTNEALVFLYPNVASKETPKAFKTSLAEVQRRTGIVFPMPPKVVHSKALWSTTLKSARAAKASSCTIK